MSYHITLSKKAIKALTKINEPYYTAIKTAIYSLADNPRPNGCKKLKGRNGYRIRIGSYRVIYDILDSELLIDIVNIGPRGDIYED